MTEWLMKKRKRNLRILMYLSIFPILFSIFILYGAYKENSLIEEIYYESCAATQSARFDAIKAIVKEKNIQTKQNTNKLKEYIIKDIFIEYSNNIYELKTDMESNKENKLTRLLQNNMNKIYVNHMNANNRLWVANRNKILADKETLMGPNRTFKSWEEEYNTNTNKLLYKNTIDRILMKDVYGDILYIDGPEIDDYIEQSFIDEPSFKNLEKMYNSKGIDEISKYNILVCSYIYDSYDIFNIPDIDSNGSYTNNDTIIIVEQYNIGDVLKEHEELFVSYDHMIDRYEYWRNQTKIKNINDTINLLVIMLVSFFLILGSTSIYVNWSEKHNGNNIKSAGD